MTVAATSGHRRRIHQWEQSLAQRAIYGQPPVIVFTRREPMETEKVEELRATIRERLFGCREADA